jgi:hypothetical protein
MSNPELSEEIGAEIGTPHDREAAVRELVGKALHSCRKRLRREQVAEQLTKAADFCVTRGMLDDWASPSKKGLRFPASLIKPLCEITDNNDLALAVLPYRVVFLVALGEWVYQSHRTLEKVHQDLNKLIKGSDRKRGKAKQNRKA